MSKKSTNEELLEELRTVFAGIGLLVVIGLILVCFWFSLGWVLTRASTESVWYFETKALEKQCFISINGRSHEIGCAPTKNP